MHRHLHFVGIGGIGMSGIAQVFFNQGYRVTGSDLNESDSVKKLRQLGIPVSIGHHASNIGSAEVVVISSAVRPNNPEVVEARRRRIPVIPRAEMLGELMRGKTGIAIAGTHGKTTTTSLLATILTSAGLDPTLVIGGKVDSLGGNAKLGHGHFVIAEADESDGSFLHLPATYAVVTNIDNDHLDHFKSLEKIDEAFLEFVANIPFYGVAAVCVEDPGVRRCLDRFTKPVVTYGFQADCDYSAENLKPSGLGYQFTVFERTSSGREKLGECTLHAPGQHNVLNALATIAISRRLGVSFPQIVHGLASFRGVGRRFEVRWNDSQSQQLIVDDYGHHPTEIQATLNAARSVWPGRLVCIFQPHRYTRTQLCKDAFGSAFAQADVLFLTDIYAAGEDPIAGVTGEALYESVRAQARPGQQVTFVGPIEKAADTVRAAMLPGDMVLCMGAGSITRLPDLLIEKLKENQKHARVTS